ncbi:MAG: hypothetical protein SVG88_03630 [Halobacteriales archaeon]|nr:hypothetical protein [Halobacteriales archaeon]
MSAIRHFPTDVFLELLALILVGNFLAYILFAVVGLINVPPMTSPVLLVINILVLVVLATLPTALVGAAFLLWSS